MARQFDGSPIARHLVFVLQSGQIVIQWDEAQVQDVFSDKLLPFGDKDYGHAITDSELDQLQEAGRISHYDRAFVWMHALPEKERFNAFNTNRATHIQRKYYLNTTLPGYLLRIIQERLVALKMHHRFVAEEQNGLVAILNEDGQPFERIADAENAQNLLRRSEPQYLGDAAVAFIEEKTNAVPQGEHLDDVDVMDLNSLIASQTKPLNQPDKLIIAIDNDEAFLDQCAEVAATMGIEFMPITSGSDALHIIEDMEPEVVLMELIMDGHHAWDTVAVMRANQALESIPIIITSALASQSDQVFALTVARVNDFLVKPVPLGLLRKSIWSALQNR